jgi:phage tail-like protein
MEYAEGGNNDFVHRLRGRARYPTISLRRGVTSQDALLNWFFGGPQADQLTITLMDPAASPIRTFGFASPFPIKWSGPDMAAGSNGAAMESLEIGHNGMVG